MGYWNKNTIKYLFLNELMEEIYLMTERDVKQD